VAVGVVCLIDTEGAKPEGSDKSEGSTAEALQRLLLLKRQKAADQQHSTAAMLQGHLSSCKKNLDEKKYQLPRLKEQERRKSY
jgi:uncharacterized protein YeaC (DUF1315 family)